MDKDEFDSDVDEVCTTVTKNVVPELPTDLDGFMEYLRAWAKRAVPKETA